MLVADLAQSRQVVVRRDDDTAAADNRLDDDGCHRLRAFALDDLFKLIYTRYLAFGVLQLDRATVTIGRIDVQESGYQRLEFLAPAHLSGRRHGAESEAVVALIAGDDLVAVLTGELLSAVLPRDFEGGLVRFGTAVAEKQVVEIAG